MADYRKMYALLCAAIDDVIDPLSEIPRAKPHVERLQAALLRAEELYIDTSPYAEETDDSKIVRITTDFHES